MYVFFQDSFADWDMGYHDNLSIGQEAEDTNHDEMLQHQINCMYVCVSVGEK